VSYADRVGELTPKNSANPLETNEPQDQLWVAMWARCARPLPNEAFSPAIS
jgi:hypothetical protein